MGSGTSGHKAPPPAIDDSVSCDRACPDPCGACKHAALQAPAAVVLARRLAQPLAARGTQRRGDVAPVAARVVAGQHERGRGAQPVGEGRQQPHDPRRGARVVLAHVEVAVARELDDPPLGHRRRRQLLVVDRRRAGDVQRAPARVAQALAEVDLVGVDEERRVEPADLLGRLAAHEQRRGLRPVDVADRLAPALHRVAAVQEERADERGDRRREAPRRRLAAAVGAQEPRARGRGIARARERGVQRRRRARRELGVLVEQQAVAPARALQQLGVVLALAAPARQRDELRRRRVAPRRARGPVAGRVVEHEHLGREGQRPLLGGDRIQAAQEQLALLGVHDAVGDLDAAAMTAADDTSRRRLRRRCRSSRPRRPARSPGSRARPGRRRSPPRRSSRASCGGRALVDGRPAQDVIEERLLRPAVEHARGDDDAAGPQRPPRAAQQLDDGAVGERVERAADVDDVEAARGGELGDARRGAPARASTAAPGTRERVTTAAAASAIGSRSMSVEPTRRRGLPRSARRRRPCPRRRPRSARRHPSASAAAATVCAAISARWRIARASTAPPMSSASLVGSSASRRTTRWRSMTRAARSGPSSARSTSTADSPSNSGRRKSVEAEAVREPLRLRRAVQRVQRQRRAAQGEPLRQRRVALGVVEPRAAVVAAALRAARLRLELGDEAVGDELLVDRQRLRVGDRDHVDRRAVDVQRPGLRGARAGVGRAGETGGRATARSRARGARPRA